MLHALPVTAGEPDTGVTGDDAAPSQRSRIWPLDRRSFQVLIVAYAAFVGVGALVGTAVTTWAADTPLGRLDRAVADWFVAQRTPWLDRLSNIGSGFSDTLTVVVVVVVLGIISAVLWRRWNEVTLLATALALEVTSFVSIAFVVERSRPPVEQLDPSPPTSGFPSGHTAAALALYAGLAIILAWRSDGRTVKRLAGGAAALIVVLVALSRMYRGMHFLTDVVAGALLGAACLAVAVHVVRRPPATAHEQPSRIDDRQRAAT